MPDMEGRRRPFFGGNFAFIVFLVLILLLFGGTWWD